MTPLILQSSSLSGQQTSLALLYRTASLYGFTSFLWAI